MYAFIAMDLVAPLSALTTLQNGSPGASGAGSLSSLSSYPSSSSSYHSSSYHSSGSSPYISPPYALGGGGGQIGSSIMTLPGLGTGGGIDHSDQPVIDCVVTPWSEWSPCSRTCGPARKERRRMIKLNPQNGGKPCPKKLVQRRKCKDNPPCPK